MNKITIIEKLKDIFRSRNVILIGGSFLVVILLYLAEPDQGAMTLRFLQQMTIPVVAVWFSYIARRALFDYLDLYKVFKKAMETATGAGYVFLGVCIITFGLLGLFGGQARAEPIIYTQIPEKAHIYIPIIKEEANIHWNDHPK